MQNRGYSGASISKTCRFAQASGPVALLALLVPVLWFPWRWPLLTLAALPLVALPLLIPWPGRRTGLEAPLAGVLVATCVATVPITDWQLGLPKVLGMALGAATLVAISNAVRSVAALDRAVLAIAGLAIALSGVGLVGAEWIVGKFPVLDPLYVHLPVLIRGVVANTRLGGIQPNELGGALVLVVPLLLAQPLIPGSLRRHGMWPVAFVGAMGLLGLGVLVATQSRSAIVGASVALALLGGAAALQVVRSRAAHRWARVGAPLVWVAAVALGAWVGWPMLARWLVLSGDAGPLDSLEVRLELWDRAGAMLQDFPFTGIGLGQFNPVLHALYAPVVVPPATFVPHAHNVYLEYALELGIPGAVAFGLVVLGAFIGCWRGVRSADPRLQWTGLGIALGLLAFLVYGFTDAIAPGARAGLVLWTMLGLGGAIGTLK
jgi:putative inorganic carbon (HCO3(-)) transporter